LSVGPAERPEIAITGAGSACAVGTGCDALWDALAQGRDGLREVSRFPVAEFAAQFAGLWPAWEGRAQPPLRGEHPLPSCFSTLEIATVAAAEAWKQARADDAGVPPARAAVILGTCFGERFTGFSELTEGLARAIGTRGPCVTVSTACSSSTAAIGLGRDFIEQGLADLVLAGGADVLTREVFAGFHALGALSPGKCAPFSDAAGTSLGEGAGFVVLEAARSARARGVEPLAMVLGYGLSADAYHETSPDPSGSGIVRAARGALEDACAQGNEIDFINAHGTGTEANDAAEWLALRTALGAAAERIPVSATKSFLGHAQGAAGVLEIIATLLCARRGTIPPTLRCQRPRPGAPPDTVAGDRPRPHAVRRFLKSSAAFGGANTAVIIGAPTGPRLRHARREIDVVGLAAVGPHGFDVAALERARVEGRRLAGPVPKFDLSRIVRWAAPRGVDPSARYVSAAAALALSDAGIAVRGSLRDRAGLFTGNSRMPASSTSECLSSIERRGITGIAAAPFARMVLNAPAGVCAKLLSLRGPHLSVSTGRGSGLFAIVWAAEHLAARADADLLVAGGHDELPVEGCDGGAEGAAFAVLAVAGCTKATSRLRLTGWGIAGPDGAREAVAQALAGTSSEVDGVFATLAGARERLAGGPVDPTRLPLGLADLDSIAGGAESAASACAFVLAAAALRRRAARRLLVVAGGDSLCCAAVLAAAEG